MPANADQGELFFYPGLGIMMAHENQKPKQAIILPGLGQAKTEQPSAGDILGVSKKPTTIGGVRRLLSLNIPLREAMQARGEKLWTDADGVQKMAGLKLVARDKTKRRSAKNVTVEMKFLRGYQPENLAKALEIADSTPKKQVDMEQLQAWAMSTKLEDIGHVVAHTKLSQDPELIALKQQALIIFASVRSAHSYTVDMKNMNVVYPSYNGEMGDDAPAAEPKAVAKPVEPETTETQDVSKVQQPGNTEATKKKSAQEAFLRAAVDKISDPLHGETYKRNGERLIDLFAAKAGKSISFRSAALIIQGMLHGGFDNKSIAAINKMDDALDTNKAAESAKHRPISKADLKAQMKQAVRDVRNAMPAEEVDFLRRLSDWRPDRLRIGG